MGLGSKIRHFFLIRTTEDFINKSIKDLVKKFANNLITIDLGCGNGNYVVNSKFKDYISKVSLVDLFSKPNKDILNNPKTQFFSTDVISFLRSRESNSVHFILAKDIFEHINKSDGEIFIEECHRILYPKGTLLIQIPNGSSPFGLRNFNNDITHIQFLGHKSLEFISKKVFHSGVKVYPVDEISTGKISFLSAIIQKKILEPLIQIMLSSSIGDCGRFFWTPNIIAINTKLS